MSTSTPTSTELLATPGDHCGTGAIHEGEPTGSIITIVGLETYVAKPKTHGSGHTNTAGDKFQNAEGKYNKILLYLSDVFGPMYVNNKLLMDTFAEHGKLFVPPTAHLLLYHLEI